MSRLKLFLVLRRIVASTFFILVGFSHLFGQFTERPVGTVPGVPYGYIEYLPENYNTKDNHPLMIVVSGQGEQGNGSTDLHRITRNGPLRLIKDGKWPAKDIYGGVADEDFVIISPQSPAWYSGDKLDALIEVCTQMYKVDKNRIYYAGLSLGAICGWEYLAYNPERLAAAVLIAGKDWRDPCPYSHVPIWAFHGTADNTVQAFNSVDRINALKNCNPPAIEAKLTLYEGVGHNSWDRTYNLSGMNTGTPDTDPYDISIYKWFLQHSKKKLSVDLGSNRSITLPTNSITLNSTINSTNTITKYTWTKQSGPAATLVNANTSTLTANSLVEGTYVFRLTVTDSKGSTAFDEVTVTVQPEIVNQAPKANAGTDQIIGLPTNLIIFKGSGSDGDGSIVGYTWTKVSGPVVTMQNQNTASLTVLGLVEGTYLFRLTVTDDDGATGSDEVNLTVQAENIPPDVDAGNDLTIQLPTSTVVLDGDVSDRDGSIASYKWTKLSGPTATLQNTTTASLTASDLIQGTYTFRLTATDDDGASAYDEVSVIVQAVNQAPSAKAGDDQSLKLPLNSTNIIGSGSDADGNITSYKWTKVSGPSATLTNTTLATLSVSNMVEGTYIFGLTVTDDDSATGYDEVSVTVNAANVAPKANAGEDVILYLPSNSTTIAGQGSDIDGTVVSYNWTKKSGPSVTISNSTNPVVSLSEMVEGTYTFTLTVTDNEGATSTDVVSVFVLVSNEPPTANAGSDKNITLPTNSLNLGGSGIDIDGSVVSYGWIKVSGPGVTMNNENTATLQLTNLVEGTYVFGLTVTDNDGAIGYDEVSVFVAPEPANITPSVTANNDIAITLPSNSVDLTSTANDPDGSIIAYLWEKSAGPSATIVTNNTQNTTVNNLVSGSYTFKVTVTDDDGATAFDVVNVTVYEESINQNPVVNAGNDITVRLPENIVSFNPTISDDGTIVSIAWQQASGPNTATFDDITIEQPTVSGLISGIYQFRITATDDEGASSSDEILVTVSEANQTPSVNAGKDIILRLPENSVNITAEAVDSDGSISTYQWSRISGPNGETLSGVNSATASISQLSQGIYVFQIFVTDNEGATASDQVKITVQAENIIPSVNAGNDISIRLPLNSTNVSGTGDDLDGTIVSYEWSKESGPMATMVNQNTATLTLNDLMEGTYVFRLTVTDNDGASNFDDVQVIVLPELANVLPIANAGSDQQITLPTNTLTLKGNGIDSDGSISAYSWSKLSGPVATLSNINTANLNLSNLTEGKYTFRLTVTDNDGGTDSDEVLVTVIPEIINQNPIANAGGDIIITLPTNSLNVNGSGFDADGSISTYLWEKVSGPSVTMSNINNSTLVLSDLVEGIYSFKLTVEDDMGASGTDNVNITVNAEDVNQTPIANAGSNKSISLPTNTVILNGSGSDADGSIASYLWQKVSGPAADLTNTDNSTLTVTSMVEGTYIFRLTVTDNKGASSFDETRVVVVGENVNSNPIVNAGKDLVIQLPTNAALLNASASDKDGSIVSYEWIQVDGESVDMSGSTIATLSVTDLDIGSYKFRITVVDDDGATDFDEVSVIVQPNDINLPPTADAGQDLYLFLPTNSANVAGKGSDNDGTIISYNWLKINGPSVTITNTDKATVSFSNMIEGEYIFRFTVTDNDGGTGQDELKVYVTPEIVNQSPVAVAGNDINLYLPENSVEILGGGNDPDGEITSYSWEQVFGPDATIAGADTSKLVLTELVEGEYHFKLTVTDNLGAIGSDFITVTVLPDGTNLNPDVDLGSDIVEFLPLDSLVLSAQISDPDGEIVNYSWLKISGATITQISQDSLLILKDLVEGTYIYRLTVEDNEGATEFDEIIITINPAETNRNPVSDAGTDLFVELPQDTVTIFGQGEDPDGDILKYEWSKVSGPDVIALEGIDNAELHLSELVEGTFVFELVVTDDKGASASDQVRLVVSPIPPENIPPTAKAGDERTLDFPVKDQILIGYGSDEDGFIVSYQWRMISGPTIDNSIVYSDTLILNGLKKGDYVYEFQVMDNDSAVVSDDVSIQVLSDDVSGIHAPKVFSPDGNGISDYWEIDNLELIEGCNLTIFNRFGLKVYESNDYQNDWDGTFNGGALPEGDYYYVIKCGDDSDTMSGGIRIIKNY